MTQIVSLCYLVKTLYNPLSLCVFSCMNSTYLLTIEERREKARRERQRARINRPRASEEESCGKFMRHLETCLLVAEADRVLCHLLIFKLSFCTASVKWNTAAIKILLLFLAGSFIGFLVEKCAAWRKVIGNHRFQKWASLSTSSCWMRKRVEKSLAFLALLVGFHELHLDRQAWIILLHLMFVCFFCLVS